MRLSNNQKGVILMVSLMVMVAVSIMLPAYVTWIIWEQKNLLRQRSADFAHTLAQAGLNRAQLDLYLDADSWLDGDINGRPVSLPNAGSPNNFYLLYEDNTTYAPNSYRVELRYLFDASHSSFYDKRMWIRSSGTTPDASRTVEGLIDWSVVKNLTRNLTYQSLQPAITEVLTQSWDNDNIAIAETSLTENISAGALRINIRGCYDPDFTYHSCSEFHSIIRGNVSVTGTADVILSGLTIE